MLKLFVLALALAAAATLLTLYLREPQIGGSRAATEPQIPGCASLRVFNGSRGVRDVRLLLRDPLFASLCGARAVDGARGACFRLAEGRVVCLPTALLIGFTKAGTTAFFRYAAQHPLVRVSRVKEPNYFGSDAGLVTHVLDDGAEADAPADAAAESAADAPPLDDVLDRASAGRASRVAGVRAFGGDKSLAWYTGLFAPACPTCARLEATPSYAWRDYSPRAAIQARALLGAGGGGGGGEACRLGGGGGGGDAPSGARMAKPAMTRTQAAEIATHCIGAAKKRPSQLSLRDLDEIEIAAIWVGL